MPPLIEDPYAVLGVANDATEADVKKAYRKLALKYHPDRQNGKSEEEIAAASEMFVKIAEAQDLLTDPVKRYDFRMKQEQEAKKSSGAAVARDRGAPPSSSVRRSPPPPSTVRKRSPVPINRQGSQHSVRRGQSPRTMNKKQGSVRVGAKPVLGRNKSDQPPQRVNSVGSLAGARSAHAPRTAPNRMGVTPPPTSQNRSKAASMLRTPSNASIMSRQKKKKPPAPVPETTFTFVRNNGKKPPATVPSSVDASGKPKKKKKKKPVDEADNNDTGDIPKKKKKKKKKPEAESEQTFTFVRNNTKPAKVDSTIKMRRRNSGDTAKKQLKAEKRKQAKDQNAGSTRFNGNASSSSGFKSKKGSPGRKSRVMMSPQQAPRRSILGFRTSVQQTPQSTKGKKKSMGIKGFLGRPPMET